MRGVKEGIARARCHHHRTPIHATLPPQLRLLHCRQRESCDVVVQDGQGRRPRPGQLLRQPYHRAAQPRASGVRWAGAVCGMKHKRKFAAPRGPGTALPANNVWVLTGWRAGGSHGMVSKTRGRALLFEPQPIFNQALAPANAARSSAVTASQSSTERRRVLRRT